MAVSNGSTVEVLFIHQQMYNVVINEGPIAKVIVALLLSVFFIYVNCIMLYALFSKHVLIETPRYILFVHMLFNDSVQLMSTSVLYCLSMISFKLITAACALLVFVASTTFFITPLNLAVMSLERYVAIRFPLRHTEIVTQKRTCLAIVLIWCIGSINFMIDLFYGILLDPNFLTSHVFCTRERIFVKPWQVDVYSGFSVFFFITVMLIIFFTYISIMITARSLSSSKESAAKAYRTVLMHFIQLALCLTMFLYSIIERAAAMSVSSNLFLDLRYLNYLFVLILPRCLSPLIYGLRDEALQPLFIYYFCYGTGKVKPTVSVH